jgi:hypothetical protein
MIILAGGHLIPHRSAFKSTPVYLNASGPGVRRTRTRPCGIDQGRMHPSSGPPRRASWKIIYDLGFTPPREYHGIIIAAYPGKFTLIVRTEWSQGEDLGNRPDAVRGLQLLRRGLSGQMPQHEYPLNRGYPMPVRTGYLLYHVRKASQARKNQSLTQFFYSPYPGSASHQKILILLIDHYNLPILMILKTEPEGVSFRFTPLFHG